MFISDQVSDLPHHIQITCAQAASSSIAWDKILSIVVAAVVAIIAFLQWYVAKEKLRLDLYNRRFDIYARVIEFLSRVNDSGIDKIAAREVLIQNCVKAAREAQFLFAKDPEITKLIDRLRISATTISDFYLVVMPNAGLYGSSFPAQAKAREEAQASIEADLPNLEKRLQPFLAFHQGKNFGFLKLPFSNEAKTGPTND